MALNKQTANFPPIGLPEISWAENIRKFAQMQIPAPAIAEGLLMGLPLASGQPTTGLTPTLTDGYMVDGDKVLGPYGSKLISAAPASEANNFYFGLAGGYYDTAAAKPTDAHIGRVLTNADSIIHVAQFSRSTAGFFAVRGVVNLEICTKGADVDLITWTKPVDLPNTRIVYAHSRVLTAATAGNTAGDDFLLKVGSTTLVTKDDANLVTAGHTDVAAAPLPTYGAATTSLTFRYNQVDTSTAIADGSMEVYVLLECF